MPYGYSLSYDQYNSASACMFGSAASYYSLFSPLVEGASLWTNIGMTNPASGGYYSNNGQWYQVADGGTITILGDCS